MTEIDPASLTTFKVGPMVEERPTGGLRFLGGRLQQQYLVIEWTGGTATAAREDWRDVPSVDG
jgi:hypothetical protein